MSLHGEDPLPRSCIEQVDSSGGPLGRSSLPYVDPDDGAGAGMDVVLLARRRIATISGPLNMCAGITALTERDALESAGCVRKTLTAEGDFSRSGYGAMAS